MYQYQNDWDEDEWEGLGIEDDLISRRAMYIALNDLGGCDATEDYFKGYDSGIGTAISALQCAPTMGEEQVRYGNWIEKRKKTLFEGLYEVSYICNCCGNKVYGKYNYCSNCGAKMDLEE